MLGLSQLRIESIAGQGLSASANMVIDPRLAEQLRAGVTGMPLMRSLEVEARAGIDAALVDVLPMEQRMWAQQLEGFGILRREADQLTARANLAGGELTVDAEVKEHPPVRAQHPVTALVDLLKGEARLLGRLVQQVGQEFLQVEVVFFVQGAASSLVSYKINR